jgi:hypothetical protein
MKPKPRSAFHIFKVPAGIAFYFLRRRAPSKGRWKYIQRPPGSKLLRTKNTTQPRFATLSPPLNDGESKTLFQAKEHLARHSDGGMRFRRRPLLRKAGAENNAPAPLRRGGAGYFPIQHFRRLMIRRLSVPVLLECEPINPSATRMAPANIIQWGYSQSNSNWSILAIAAVSPYRGRLIAHRVGPRED